MPGETSALAKRRALARDREVLAWDLVAKGFTQQKIAEEIAKAGLGEVTQQAVAAMLKRVELRAFEEMSAKVGGMKAMQTNALMAVYREAWAAWEKSKQPAKTLTKEADDGGAKGGKVTTKIEERVGDPRYLERAQAALADIRKIWGLDAPQKVAPTSADGGPLEVHVRNLTDEELLRILAGAHKLGEVVEHGQAVIGTGEGGGVGQRTLAPPGGANGHAGVHDLYMAGLPGELASSGDLPVPERLGAEEDSPTDDFHAAADGEERAGE